MTKVFLRMYDSEKKNLLDSICGDYEDSFSLESFQDLAKSHEEVGRSFIIARVETYDAKQPGKSFYSYYDAFHLNKVLFQTQVILKKRYIHRLHVLNPLTNTDIIGNVQYFVVGKSVDSPAAKPVSSLDFDGFDSVASPTVKAIERGDKISWTTANHHIIGEDGKSDVSLLSLPALPEMKQIQVGVDKYFPSKNSKKRHSLSITINLPNSFADLDTFKKVDISPGFVTQFSVPIPAEKLDSLIPKIIAGNRRALSYRNALSASTAPVSFLEWTRLIEQEAELGVDGPSFYEDINISLLGPAISKNTDDSPANSSKKEQCFYDAVLFATDDDYLGSSKIRKLFNENALDVEEVKLFEMKEYTGELEEEARNSVQNRRTDIPMCIIQ